MESTGIALFVYKRPSHTERVLEGLRANEVDHLYIFADGPSAEDNKDRIDAVREVCHEIDWCETTIIERSENMGLARSTIHGVNYVLDRHERIITLEDDDVPTPDFIDYMSACLSRYEENSRVMNVTGYSPPIVVPDYYDYDVYFTYRDCSWGWATWRDAWNEYTYKPDSVLQQIDANPEVIQSITQKAGEDLFPIIKQAVADKNDSWSVWWAWTLLRNGGLSVNPVQSRIQNIGHDGTGTHSKSTDKYSVETVAKTQTDINFPREVAVDEIINNRFNSIKTRGRIGRIIEKFRRKFGAK